MKGEVIGINTFIFSGSGGNEGVGFAIPSNQVRKVYESLVKGGKVSRGYLGVTVEPLDDAKARMFGVEPNSGVLIRDVQGSDSPAAKAGIRSGDIITAFEGKAVTSPNELIEAVSATPVGRTAKVEFVRDGEKKTVNVQLVDRSENLSARADDADTGGDIDSHTSKLGVTVQTVTSDIAKRFKLRIESGALVVEVQQGSPAAEAGISSGDVIHRLDKQEILSAEDLIEASRSISGSEVAVQIERKGRMAFITIKMD